MKKVCMMVTNPVTNDSRVINEASTLSSNGYEVIVLGVKDNKSLYEEKINGFKIKRLTRKMRPNTFLGKLEVTLKFSVEAFRQNAVIYHSNDLSTLLECYIAAKFRHAKLIYDSHEVCADPKVQGIKNWLYSQLEKLLINHVDAIMTVNIYIAKYLEERYKLKQPVTVLMNCPPLKLKDNKNNIVISNSCVDIIKTKKQENKKILIYQGIIHEERCLAEIIEAMIYLPENYCLFIFGAGDLLPKLKIQVLEQNLSNRVYLPGLLSLEQLLMCTQLADIGITLTAGKTLNAYYSSPNKLFQYIHAGIPIIARDYPFLKDIIKGYDIGYTLESIDPSEIAAAIKYVLEDDIMYSKMKANTIKAKERFNWEKELLNLIELYKKQ